jgi:hypothetical protein
VGLAACVSEDFARLSGNFVNNDLKGSSVVATLYDMTKPIEITVEIVEGEGNPEDWEWYCFWLYNLYLEHLAETSQEEVDDCLEEEKT